MPQPTKSSVHVNRPLTNISTAYIQKATDFIADKCFPIVPVAKQSDRYFTYNKGDWYRDEVQKRAPSTESAGGGYTIDNTPNYYCDVWAFHKDVSDQIRNNADAPLNPDRDATRFVAQRHMLRKDKHFASQYFTTGLWTGSSTGADITPGTLWDAAGSDPMADVDAEKEAIHAETSYMPNVLIVGTKVHTALKNNEAVKDIIKYTQRAIVTEDLLAAIFGVDKYLVARANENTAAENATVAMSRVFTPEDALLLYSAPAPSIMEPSAGYIFTWTGLLGAGAFGNTISKFRMEHLKSDRIEGEMAWDMKVVATDLGAYFDGAVS